MIKTCVPYPARDMCAFISKILWAETEIKMKVTKDTIIMDVLKIDPKTAVLFMEIGMHCVGCPSASNESIEQACVVHGADADALVNKINDYLESK